jgi:flagellar motor switch protein FliN/FliY
MEICGHMITAVAAGITADSGREITAAPGRQENARPEDIEWKTFEIRDPEGDVFRLQAGWSSDVAALYAGTPDGPASKTLDLLLDVALPITVSFGKTSLQIREVLKLSTGSIVELNRFVSDPVDVVINGCVIARGEVVVVDGNYGVRITHLSSREDRLRSGMKEAHNRLGGRI